MSLSRSLHGRADSDQPALVFDGRVHTYRQVVGAVGTYVVQLRRLGVVPGDRLVLALGNAPEFFSLAHAAWSIGASVAPMGPHASAVELATAIRSIDASGVVLPEPLGEPLPIQALVVGADLCDFEAAVAHPTPLAPPADPEHPAFLAFTSGTEGVPKAAMIGHRAIQVRMQVVGEHLGLDEGSPILQYLPASSSGPSLNGVLFAWHLGSLAVLLPRFTPAAVAEAIERHRPAYFASVPTMLYDLLHSPEPADLGSVRYLIFGAAVCPADLRAEVEDRFGVKLVHAYGQTEAPSMVCTDPIDEDRRPGSLGRPLPHVEIVVEDEDHRPCPPGVTGQITVRPATTGPYAGWYEPFSGYWGNPEATARALAHGVLHTGDAGHVDEDGFVWFASRMRDVIVSGGNTIYAAELERALTSVPGVAEAAVVGEDDRRLGQVPIGWVVVDDPSLDDDDVLDRANQLLSPHKRIRALVRMEPEGVPRNAMGKIQKHRLPARPEITR